MGLLCQKYGQYAVTRHTPSAEELKRLTKVLYEETQGITDLAIKAFMFSQERAIELNNGEEITPSIIKSVVKDKFQMLAPALKAFKENNKTGLAKLDDAYPKFLDDLITKGQLKPFSSSIPISVFGKVADEPEVKILINQETPQNLQLELSEEEKTAKTSERIRDKQSKKTSKNSKKNPKGEIENIINSSENTCSAYESLKNKGLILSTDSFFTNELNGEEV